MTFEQKIIHFLHNHSHDLMLEHKSNQHEWKGFTTMFPQYAYCGEEKEQFRRWIDEARKHFNEYVRFVRSRTRNQGRAKTRQTVERMCVFYCEQNNLIHDFALSKAMSFQGGV